MADNVLDRIVAGVRARLAARPPAADVEARALAAAAERDGSRRSLRAALERPGPAVIAECKYRSPSAGVLRADFDPVELARAYAAGGAAAVSVVTEPDYFGGDEAWIGRVRGAVPLPVLRKDFIVTADQLYGSVLAGADAVLLIQRILDPGKLAELLDLCSRLRLEALVEVFPDENPGVAVAAGAELIGVNSRDLATFAVDLKRVEAMAGRIPADRIRVAESGIHRGEDLRRLQRAGYDAFLVGEHLVRSADPEAALQALLDGET
jgi:indole-3-glycerol phosphate synthase